MRKLMILLVFSILAVCNCYSIDLLGNTISQAKSKMSKDYPDVKIDEADNNQGGKTLFQDLPDVIHFAYFNKKGICNLERMWPKTDAATKRIKSTLMTVSYVHYLDERTAAYVYKIKVEDRIVRVDYCLNDGVWAFEYYYLNSNGTREMFNQG